jgi:acyl dehydratase
MTEAETPAGMKAYIGQHIGTSDWVLVDQARINAFADATGDHQWIHVDTERAAREMPNGKTIAHGYLSLSLIPMFSYRLWSIRKSSSLINYGANKIRFTSMVPVDSRVRLSMALKAAEDAKGGVRLFFDCVVEIEGSEKPALVAEVIFMALD